MWGTEAWAALIRLDPPPIRVRQPVHHPDNCVLTQTYLKQRMVGSSRDWLSPPYLSPQWSASSCSHRGPGPVCSCHGPPCCAWACPRSGAWSCPGAWCRASPCPHWAGHVWTPGPGQAWSGSDPGASGQRGHCGNQSSITRNIHHSQHLQAKI